eukprot:Nitzschia sp. Nitz4//scaffold229_size32011//11797//12905//NITZ4_007917-RA/size32011-snap-gene-0.3-mRNA-1//-1//CDS//3329542853//7824//frame0
MLAADKLQLQSQLKQQATALKEKEFNLHHSNLMTVGTQAAVLAGLDITMFIEFNPPINEEWGESLSLVARVIKFGYYLMIVSAFCANMVVVSHTTVLSVLGAGMALRGPDGSMMTATDGLYEERKSVFASFGMGLACTVGSVVLGVWLLLKWEAALCCMVITLITCRTIWTNYERVQQRFSFDESQTVDFRDIMEGPAAIQAVPLLGFGKRQAAQYKYKKMEMVTGPTSTTSIGANTTKPTTSSLSRQEPRRTNSLPLGHDNDEYMGKQDDAPLIRRGGGGRTTTHAPHTASGNLPTKDSTYIQTV